MLSLHTNRTFSLRFLMAVAVILTVGFVIKNDTYAYETNFNNQYFGQCIHDAFLAEYPDESIPMMGLQLDQIARVKTANCDYTEMGYTNHYPTEKIDDIDEDLQKLTSLENLTITGWGTLTHLNLSFNLGLKTLNIAGENVSEINIEMNHNLTDVNLSSNNLSSLTLPVGHELTNLDVSHNNLAVLDTSGAIGLQYLKAEGNALGELDLRRNTELVDLTVEDIIVKPNVMAIIMDEVQMFDLMNARYIGNGNTLEVANTGYTWQSANRMLEAHGLTIEMRTLRTQSMDPNKSYMIELPFVILSFDLMGGLVDGEDIAPVAFCVLQADSCTATIPAMNIQNGTKYFMGWSNNGVIGPWYQAGDGVVLMGDTMLYAGWEDTVARSVNFNANGGGGSVPAEQSCRARESVGSCEVTIPEADLTRTNYNFLGWAESANAESATYGSGEVISLTTTSKTLYAVWGWTQPTWTVSYNLQGGMGTMPEQSCVALTEAGCTIVIPNTEIVFETADFTGWTKLTPSLVPMYSAGETIMITGNTVLYATMQAAPMRALSFNMNGGQGEASTVYCYLRGGAQSCEVTIPNYTIEREGYSFLGWAGSEDAETAQYQAGDTVTLTTQGRTLHAVWEWEEPPVWTLNFDAGVPARSCSPTGARDWCTVQIPSTSPSREDEYFSGWSEESGGTTVDYGPSGTVTLTGNKTLYAVWEPIVTYTLAFVNNNGSGRVPAQSCSYVPSMTPSLTCEVGIPGATPTRTGYRFLGWGETSNQTEPDYAPGDNVTLYTHKNLYAVWEWIQPTWTLSFDANNGSGTAAAQNCSPANAVSRCSVQVPDATMSRNGFWFLGWSEDRLATTPTYVAQNTVELDGSKTLYAVWEEIINYKVDLYKDYYATSPYKTVTCAVAHGASSCVVEFTTTQFTKTTQYMLGWSEDSRAEMETYSYEGTITMELFRNKRLYGVWVPIYELRFALNGGEAEGLTNQTCRPTSVHGNCSVTIPDITPVKEGHDFLGYTGNYQPGDTVTFLSGNGVWVELKARWSGEDDDDDDEEDVDGGGGGAGASSGNESGRGGSGLEDELLVPNTGSVTGGGNGALSLTVCILSGIGVAAVLGAIIEGIKMVAERKRL